MKFFVEYAITSDKQLDSKNMTALIKYYYKSLKGYKDNSLFEFMV